MRGRRMVAVATLVSVVAGIAATGAVAKRADVETLRSVSPPNPFADGCGRPAVMPNSEFEPTLAASSRNPRRLITAWMQGHRPDGGAMDVLGAFSSSRGRRWKQTRFPGSGPCTGAAAHWTGAGDPWMSIGPDERAYLTVLTGRPGEIPDDPLSGFPVNPLNAFAFNSRLAVYRSSNGGRTWSSPVAIDQPIVSEDRFPDRPRLTADPRRPGHAYLIWLLIDDPVGPRGVYFSKTTDGGRTWSDPELAAALGNGFEVSPSELLVLGDGSLLAVLIAAQDSGDQHVVSARSVDQGDTWSDLRPVYTQPRGFRTGDPETGDQKFDAGRHVTAAEAPNGVIYTVLQDNESAQSSRILMSKSKDGGVTWSQAQPIVRCRCQTFKPLVAVRDRGTVGVVYYSDEHDVMGDDEWTVETWFIHSHDGGRSWRRIRIGKPFDYRQPPGQNSFAARHVYAAGDYAQNLAVPGGFGAAFFMGRGMARQGRSDIFFARIGVGSRRSGSDRAGHARR